MIKNKKFFCTYLLIEVFEMKNNTENRNCTKEKKVNNIEFSIAFNENGDSFQNIMEKILINKLVNTTNNE